jgi:hypothetical protein
MKSLSLVGLAMLLFAATLALCPAAQAWQSGRWTTVPASTTAQQSNQSIPAHGAVQAVRPGEGQINLTAVLQTAGRPVTLLATRTHQVNRRLVRGYLRHAFNRRNPRPMPIPTPTVSPTSTPTPSPDPTPTVTAAPTSTATPTPVQGTVAVPSNATKTQINACVAKAVATGTGTWVVFPAGKFAYSGTFIVPDGINVRGQGIWDQGLADGGGGTWLQCSNGMDWGSYSTIEYLLVGQNTAGLTCTFHPVARGSSAAGADTQVNGSHDVVFNFVRFKGGSDSGASLIDLGGNYGGDLWSGKVRTCDMIDTNWYDCEFERPQVTNATAGISSGAIMNIWLDCRAGGAQVYGNGWYRCHFGVANGYHSGIDGYGIGRTILFQPAPAEHASDGPRPSGGSNNMSFDWSAVDHGFSDNRFEDCLFEYSLWYPMDICDYARSYSLTNSFNGVVGSNPPTAAQAAAIPDKFWTIGFDMTGCYVKGCYQHNYGVQGEIGKNCIVTNSSCGTGPVFDKAGEFGNVVSGSFSNATRQITAIFPAGTTGNWTGGTTSYTPSPYDP